MIGSFVRRIVREEMEAATAERRRSLDLQTARFAAAMASIAAEHAQPCGLAARTMAAEAAIASA